MYDGGFENFSMIGLCRLRVQGLIEGCRDFGIRQSIIVFVKKPDARVRRASGVWSSAALGF